MSEPRKTPSNYRSGTDYTMEFGKYRFRFSARDFRERCEFAAVQLAFVPSGSLKDADVEQLVQLVAHGHITPEVMGDGLARRLGVPRARLGGGVDPAILNLLDERSRRRYSVVPIGVDPGGALLLAMADPADVLTIDDLRLLVGRDVRPALALESEIEGFLAAGNPGFVIWWLAVGAGLVLRAVECGPIGFMRFAIVHWSCDLGWNWLVSACKPFPRQVKLSVYL